MSADSIGFLVAVGDPAANRVVYGTVIALVVIGLVLIGVAIWLIRQTRVDPELLAPLEKMSDRSWQRKDPATQRRMLDDVRPEGAAPLHREPSAPELVEEFGKPAPIIASFDDLKEPAAGAGEAWPDPQPEASADGVEDGSPDGDDDEAEVAEVVDSDGGGEPDGGDAAGDDDAPEASLPDPHPDAAPDEPSTDAPSDDEPASLGEPFDDGDGAAADEGGGPAESRDAAVVPVADGDGPAGEPDDDEH